MSNSPSDKHISPEGAVQLDESVLERIAGGLNVDQERASGRQ